jgi:hypothetical protein
MDHLDVCFQQKDDRQISCGRVIIKEQRKPNDVKKTNKGEKLRQLTSPIQSY